MSRLPCDDSLFCDYEEDNENQIDFTNYEEDDEDYNEEDR